MNSQRRPRVTARARGLLGPDARMRAIVIGTGVIGLIPTALLVVAVVVP